jgi:hypothetical protein
MASKVFRSKVDWWIRLLLGIAIAGMFVGSATVILEGADPVETTVTILACIAGFALIVWVLTGTHYTVDRGTLIVRAGPMRWRIPIDEITAVEATRSPLSSPALSLDRLRIRYGKRRRIMISPADKAGLLKAIGQDLKT